MLKKNLAELLLAAVTCMIMVSCNGKKNSSGTTLYKDEIHIAVQQEAPSLDLHKNSSLIARQMCSGTVWEKLVTLNANAEPVPELCSSYTVSKDAKEFVFYLRKGVKFHDGTEMKAEDVCASMNRWFQGFSVAGKLVGSSRFEKIDDYTVKIKLEKPALTLPDVIAGAAQPAMITTAAACANEDAKGMVKEYIGTGPYKFDSWVQDQYIKLEKFNDYVPYGKKGEPMDGWAGYKDPKIKTLYFDIVKEATTRVAGLQTGQYDLIYNLTDDTYDMASRIPNVQIQKAQEGTVAYVFNKKQGIASNLYFRQAVNAAIDCDELLGAAYGKFYDLGSCYMDSAQPFWYSEAGKENYNQKNPEKAKELLAKAEYKGQPFRILVSTLSNMDKSALVMKQELEKIGINTQLIVVDWATLTQYRTDPSRYDIYFTSFASVPVPSLKLYFGPSYPGWSEDRQLQNYMADFNSAVTKDDAKKAWDILQGYSWEYLPLINAGHYVAAYAWNKKLSGLDTYGGVYFWNASSEK